MPSLRTAATRYTKSKARKGHETFKKWHEKAAGNTRDQEVCGSYDVHWHRSAVTDRVWHTESQPLTEAPWLSPEYLQISSSVVL